MTNLQGLDMGKTLDWYVQHGIALPTFNPSPLSIPHQGLESIDLKPEEIGGLVSLVTPSALSRSTLKEVVGQGPLYFSMESSPESPKATIDTSQALSPTAIIPSFIQYGDGTSRIFLYRLPKTIAQNIRRIVSAQGFMHELGHSIAQNALFSEQNLVLPNNQMISGFDAMMEFAKLAEQHPPISRYASTYRGENGKFESERNGYNPITAISEEFAETFAAHYLGFACNESACSPNSLVDRPEISEWMKSFLEAKEQKTQA